MSKRELIKKVSELEADISRLSNEVLEIRDELYVYQNDLRSARAIINQTAQLYSCPTPRVSPLHIPTRTSNLNTPRFNPHSFNDVITPIESKYHRHLLNFNKRIADSLKFCRSYNHNLSLTQNVDCDIEEAEETHRLFQEYHHFLDITEFLPLDPSEHC